MVGRHTEARGGDLIGREPSRDRQVSSAPLSPCKLKGNLFFMSSRSSVATSVSCTSGNKANLWIFSSLLPGFLGTPIVYVNFQLFKAIVRIPSSSVIVSEICGGSLP
ncbi:hypothetical protein J5N97_014662 [Dioscorea zingiberensis]|uniref:Uncharacterized protein n=1 Tax=Dioscorea zingiberensis TaxID=325984 RepID=A0A9D5HJZ7_9LILI|nr:hypothetical protein J5N97_014662 [Dioscorea zingiberensis]